MSEVKTDWRELQKSHDLLMSNAPISYKAPWYFPVEANGKNPDGIAIYKRAGKTSSCCNANWIKVKKGKKTRTVCEKCGIGWGSWKAPHARLSIEEAIERLKEGGNIGISSRDGELLVIYDRDDADVIDKVKTLTTLSRKRIAGHSFCWRKEGDESLNTNIPTEVGEVRSADQYVVCAGSYVPVLWHKDKPIARLGLYTVEKHLAPVTITFNQLPDVFLEQVEKNKKNVERIKALPKRDFKTIKGNGKQSALFSLTIEDVITGKGDERFTHPLHASDSLANFSVSDNLAHCWRHLVSLNPIQYLCVEAGHMACEEAGSGHWNSDHGASWITGDDGAIFHAWRQAKLNGIIPMDDKIPTRAIHYIVIKHKLMDKIRTQKPLPYHIYREVIKIVERDY